MKKIKNYKMFLCLFLVFAVSFALLSGCGKKSGDSAGGEYISETGFWIGLKALDYVEMFNYKALSIPNDVHFISDDALQDEIKNMLAEYSTELQVTDRTVNDGDTVNIDYVGSINGVEFEGGSTGGAGTDVTIGVTIYIDDFLEQLIGNMPGNTINVEVTFPDDYHAEDLKGKDAVFVTTINYIVESEEPELNDAFVAANFSDHYGWKTVAEMKAGMKSEMQKDAIRQYIKKHFTTEVKIKSVPERMIQYQEENMINYYKGYAEMYGMTLDEFLNSFVGFANADELTEHYKTNNIEEATYLLVIQAIAEDMKFSISEEDMEAYFLKFAGSSDYTQYIEQYGLPYLKNIVLSQKVLDYIVENAILA